MMSGAIKKYQTRYFHLVWAIDALKELKGRVLDVGCGQGGITAGVKEALPHLEVYGCDNSQKQLEVFLKSNKELGIKLKKCDAHKLSYGDNQFNSVLMIDVLEHLRKPKKALSEAARVLKKSGVFHLVIPLEAELTTFDGWIKKLFGKNLKKEPIGHIHQFTLKDIKELLRGRGFRIKRIRYSYHFVYQLISFIYFLYVNLARRGKYMLLKTKSKSINKLIEGLSNLVGWLVYVESSILAEVEGQTAHITATKV